MKTMKRWMEKVKGAVRRRVRPLVVMTAVVATAAVVAIARAGDWIPISINVASGLTAVTNGTVTSTSGTPFAVPQDTRGWGFMFLFSGANAGTSNVIYGFNVTSDGTNYSTTYPITFTNQANGTNPVVGWFPLTNVSLIGVKKMRLDEVITTQTNAITTSGALAGCYGAY